MDENEPKEVYGKIKNCRQRDVGRGFARISNDIAQELGLEIGDGVEIENPENGQKTVALYMRLFTEKFPMDHSVRIDGSLRRNLKASIDERVIIRKIDIVPAETVELAPIGRPIRVRDASAFNEILQNRVILQGNLLFFDTIGGPIHFVIKKVFPKGRAVQITHETQIQINEKPINPEDLERSLPVTTYEDIGGLHDAIQKTREMIELPMRHPELFNRLGITPPKGLLLHGPPGTGKTLLARAVANETDAHYISISGPEIMSKFYGASEENLRNIFKEAQDNAPAIIFIDEIDSIARKREEVQGEVEQRVVAQLLSLMDGLDSRGDVVVIGATNRVNALDPALRRPGRFDREIEIGVPTKEGRHEILQVHTRNMPLSDDVDLKMLAEKTHGFVGADLQSLTKEAAMFSLRKIIPELNLEEDIIPPEILNKLEVNAEHFKAALTAVEPSALREVMITTPSETWNDIGGLDKVKQELQEAIEWPLKYPSIYEHLNGQAPSGILLYGLPGTGKTLLAKALAHESEVNFISVKGPEFLSKWVGESEKAVRETFRKARTAAPCIIFIDEIDSIAPIRGAANQSNQVTERIVSQLLTEIDGMEKLNDVIIIGATNRPDIIEPALLRSGRFSNQIEVPLPDEEAMKSIFKIHLNNTPLDDDVKIDDLVKKMKGRTGADIQQLCHMAIQNTIREAVTKFSFEDEKDEEKLKEIKVKQEHFEKSIESTFKQSDRSKKSYVKQEGSMKDEFYL